MYIATLAAVRTIGTAGVDDSACSIAWTLSRLVSPCCRSTTAKSYPADLNISLGHSPDDPALAADTEAAVARICLEYHDKVTVHRHDALARRLADAGFAVRTLAHPVVAGQGWLYAERLS